MSVHTDTSSASFEISFAFVEEHKFIEEVTAKFVEDITSALPERVIVLLGSIRSHQD